MDGSWHIWTVGFDGGPPRQLTGTAWGEVYPTWAPDGGSLLFHTWSAPRRIGRISVDGGPVVFLAFEPAGSDGLAELSPDGRLVAFTRTEAQAERIYLAPASGGNARLLTSSPAVVPGWSPDGSRIAFAAHRGYSGGIWIIGADGTGERQLTADGGWPVWWPDGRQIGYLAFGAQGDQEIRLVALDGTPPRTFAGVKFGGTNHPFAISRDGGTLVISNAVHVSDEIWLLEPRR
jgi:Tol biopolymer transport system component